MASNTTNIGTEKCLQWDFLVKVSGNCLEFNPDALKLLVGSVEGSTPVVILSVVGEPKSGKTFLMNRIISYFRQFFHPSGRHHPQYPDMHGQEGILVWVYPEWIQRSDDTWTALLFLDIQMENPREDVYTKLVDFCLSLSSTVIFSVPCAPNANVYWQPSCSSLSLGSTDLTPILQLHFFVLTKHPSLDLYVTYCHGEDQSSSEQFWKKVGAVTHTAAFLSSRCKVITLTRIPWHENQGDLSTCHWNHPEPTLFEKILKSSINSPVDISTASVNMSNIRDWLQQSIPAPNCVPDTRHNHGKTEQDFDSILQQMKQQMSGLQDEIEAELKKELSENPNNFTSMVLEKFERLYDPKTYDIPDFFREQIIRVLFHPAKDLPGTLGKMNEMINAYIENVKMRFREKIYLDSFETVHDECLRIAKSTTSYRDSGRKTLDDLYREAIENLKKGFKEQNKDIYSQEDEISKKAYQHAVQKYKDFMQEKISTSVLTRLELKGLHDFAGKTISTLFLEALKGKSTPPWNNQHELLNKFLESSLSYYDTLRQSHVDIIRTDGFAAGRACYQEEMKTWLPETRVPEGNLADGHNRAESEALVKVRAIAKSKKVPDNIGKELEDEFKACLSDLRQQFSIENHCKREPSASYSASSARPPEMILESIKPLLVAQEERHGFKVTVGQDQKYSVVRNESPPPPISSTESRNRTEKLLQSVRVLVDKVKVELEKSTATTVTVRENIESKIQRCEEFLMMNAAEVKVLQLEVARSNLERAEKLIKT